MIIAVDGFSYGASLDRTESAVKRMGDIISQTPGVEHAVQFSGLNIMGGFVNGKVTRAAALVGAGVVLMLNMVLIAQALGLQVPGLSAAG